MDDKRVHGWWKQNSKDRHLKKSKKQPILFFKQTTELLVANSFIHSLNKYLF